MTDQSEDELWLPIDGYEGRYEITVTGRVRSLDRRIQRSGPGGVSVTEQRRGTVLKPFKRNDGKLQVVLHQAPHVRHCHFINSLVRRTFGVEPR